MEREPLWLKAEMTKAIHQTSWQERRDFEERLHDGQNLTAQETQSLIEDADAAERSEAILEGLRLALKSRFGILLVDATTDDDADGEIRIELVPIDERETWEWRHSLESDPPSE